MRFFWDFGNLAARTALAAQLPIGVPAKDPVATALTTLPLVPITAFMVTEPD